MPTVPVKNSRPRSAQVWQWAAEEFLDDFVVQARAERDGRLFDPPTRQRRSWLPSFEAFLRDVAAQHGYPYTPHWHRHAYASLNLAPVSDGGYDKGVPKVAEWLGVTVRHVRRLVQERRIPFIKWGNLLRFDPDEVEAWIRRHHIRALAPFNN